MKGCNKCQQGKELDEFHNHKRKKDGKGNRCKECVKQYQKDNKEYIRQCKKQGRENNKEHKREYERKYYQNNKEYMRQYRTEYEKQGREENKEYIKELQKEYYENNKEYIKELQKKYIHSLISGNENTKRRKEIEKYEDVSESINNNLACRCTYCREGFEPTKIQVESRLSSINGNSRGENKLYCSEECKENCPIYNQNGHPKGQKPEEDRELQSQLRRIVFQRDNYTCQNCKTHVDDLDVGIHCHHIIPINEDPILSLDTDNCKTLCEYCHKEAHQKPGCGYNELKCG